MLFVCLLIVSVCACVSLLNEYTMYIAVLNMRL